MGGVRLQAEYNGEELRNAMREGIRRGVQAVIGRAQKLCMQAVSISGRGVGGAVSPPSRNRPGRGNRRPLPEMVEHSRPGEPPRSLNGKGRQSIMSQMVDERSGIVGTTLKYMGYLEMGVEGGTIIRATRKRCLAFPGFNDAGAWDWILRRSVRQGAIAPRPWLVPTVENNLDLLRTVFANAAGTTLPGLTVERDSSHD